MILHGSEIQEGMGDPPILLAENAFCNDCGKEHEFEKCPKCESWIDVGYGLRFGGFGIYKSCKNQNCDWWYKDLDEE